MGDEESCEPCMIYTLLCKQDTFLPQPAGTPLWSRLVVRNWDKARILESPTQYLTSKGDNC